MSELEARLEQWRAVRAWLAWQQRQTEQTIRALEAQLAASSPGRSTSRQPAPRRPVPAPVSVPDWKVESMRTAEGPKPYSVHVGECAMGEGRAISRDEARRLLAEGVEACPFCSPENALGMTG
ncbi:DUF6233 domain-containing protein [Streptomyces sp. NPDC058289]|uniref:DUF6233 domain-containing protein n=1 Tax=Streptomyces sp. NPDC058289 TaxID=3346425 RepID=UPI0036E30BD0